MPRGVYARKTAEKSADTGVVDQITEPQAVRGSGGDVQPKGANKDEGKAETKEKAGVVLSCPHPTGCQCQDALGPGQAYFEDGPTGTHIIGDSVKNEIWWRKGNNGKGCWVNKKR